MTTNNTTQRPPAVAERDLEFALMLSSIGERIALSRFQRADLVTQVRADGSIVTDADGTIERTLARLIADWRPDDGIFGEEYGDGRRGRARRWIIDPIEGSRDFAAGGTHWGVLVALEVEGTVEVGVLATPALSKRWFAARGEGAYCNGGRIRVRATSKSARPVVVTTAMAEQARAHNLPEMLQVVVAGASAIDVPQVVWPEMLVAEGVVDVAAGQGGRPWELAARQIVVEEAGGVFSDFAGVRRSDGGSSLACSSLLLHRQVLGIQLPGEKAACRT